MYGNFFLYLKVDQTGYQAIPLIRFGTRFLNRLANPSDLLLFKRKNIFSGKKGADYGVMEEPIPVSEISSTTVADLVSTNQTIFIKCILINNSSKTSIFSCTQFKFTFLLTKLLHKLLL